MTLLKKEVKDMLDETDLKILSELTENGRMTMRELGKLVHLTAPATAARVEKMEESGVIEGYTIKTNNVKLDYNVHALITVMMDTADHGWYFSFLESADEYVMNNYKISGEGCYMLECRFPSHDVTDEFLKTLSEYANYKLSIVIKK